MSDLVGNPEDRFSQNEAHFFLLNLKIQARLFVLASRFESFLVRNPDDRFLCDGAYIVNFLSELSNFLSNCLSILFGNLMQCIIIDLLI